MSEVTSSSGDHLAFTQVDPTAGPIDLAPQSSREVRFLFHPSEKKSYLAFVKTRAAEDCPAQNVMLTGTGVDHVLLWAPATVEFGNVKPGTEAIAQITFVNQGNDPAELRHLTIDAPDEFHVVADEGQDTTSLVVPGKGGTATLTVACTPVDLGPRLAGCASPRRWSANRKGRSRYPSSVASRSPMPTRSHSESG